MSSCVHLVGRSCIAILLVTAALEEAGEEAALLGLLGDIDLLLGDYGKLFRKSHGLSSSDDRGLAVGTLESTAESLCESGLNSTGKSLLENFLDESGKHGGDLMEIVEIAANLIHLAVGASSGAVHDLHQSAESVDMSTDSSDMGVDGANLGGEVADLSTMIVVGNTLVVVMSLMHLTQTVDVESKGTSGIKNASFNNTEDIFEDSLHVKILSTRNTLLIQGLNNSLSDFANNRTCDSLLIVGGESSLDSVGRGDSSCLANNSVEVLTNILVTEQALDGVTNMSIAVLMYCLRITLLDATGVLNIECVVLLSAASMLLKDHEVLVVVKDCLAIGVRSSGVGEATISTGGFKVLSKWKKLLGIDRHAIADTNVGDDGSKGEETRRGGLNRRNLSGLYIVLNSGVLSNRSVVDSRVTNGDGRTRGRGGRVVLSDSVVGRERIDEAGSTIVTAIGLSSHVGTSRSTRDVATARGDVANCKTRDARMTDSDVVTVNALSSRDSDLGALRFHCASRWNEERLDPKC